MRLHCLSLVAVPLLLAGHRAAGQSSEPTRAPAGRLSLGYAVDTTVVPSAWWGVDSARASLPGVVRAWNDYLAVRPDAAQRPSHWSAADRARSPDPDLLAASESYILTANAELVEALPVVAGDSSRWLLRTVYFGGGTNPRPGLLGMERSYMVREDGRWVLTQAAAVETAGWRRVQVGPIEYVVDPAIHFDLEHAQATARWAQATARRFGVSVPAPITYYDTPDLDAAFRVMGLDWVISADRVGGRANTRARVVFAANPRFAEAYVHELAHVLLAPIVTGKSQFVGEGIAYWLGGARGLAFPQLMHDLGVFLDAHPQVTLDSILARSGSETAASARLPAAAAVFELAYRRSGDQGVLRFIAFLGNGEPTIETVANAFGMTPTGVQVAWRSLIASY